MSLSMTIGMVCLLGLLVIFVLKFVNINKLRKKEKQLYEMDLVMVGAFLSLVFWVGFMASMSGALLAEDTIVGTTTYTVNYYSDFYSLQAYYWLVVFLFVMNLALSFVEGMSRVEFMVREYTGG